MNRGEVQMLLRSVAATWPGTPVSHEAVDLWLAACGDLDGSEAAKALAHWAATESHPPRPADLNAAHRALYPSAAEWRADSAPGLTSIRRTTAGYVDPGPEFVHAELAKMRELLRGAQPRPSRS